MNKTQTSADAQLLRDSLGDLPEPSVNPAFIIVSGLPGSGKSYLCRRLAERLELPVIESDALRRLLFPSPDHGRRESERLPCGLGFRIPRKSPDQDLELPPDVAMPTTLDLAGHLA